MPRPPALPRSSPLRRRLFRLYDALHRRFGPQRRWPARSRLEVVVGAILAQRTAGGHAERALTRHLARRHRSDLRRFLRQPAAALRAELLSISGIGPETADAILLYAAGRPVFVADAYTRRILVRHRIVAPDADYAAVQTLFMANLPRDPALFNEYHALLVRLAKEYCRAIPRCERCPLRLDLGGRPPRAYPGAARRTGGRTNIA